MSYSRPPLTGDFSTWHNFGVQRIYDVLNKGSRNLGPLVGDFVVDGFPIRVLPPEGKGRTSRHRVCLVYGNVAIPVGRVAQYFAGWRHISHSTGPDDGIWARISRRGADLIELAYWADLDSSAIPTHGKYNVVASQVSFDDSRSLNAIRYCGLTFDNAGGIYSEGSGDDSIPPNTYAWRACLASCLSAYGAKDRLLDISGGNRGALMARARGAF